MISKRVANTIISQVPCVFAQDNESEIGTHYVRVSLDKYNNLIDARCECIENHGEEVVLGMQELEEDSNRVKSCANIVKTLVDRVTGVNNQYHWHGPFPDTLNYLNLVSQNSRDAAMEKRQKRKCASSKDITTETEPMPVAKKRAILKARAMNLMIEKLTGFTDVLRVECTEGSYNSFALRYRTATVAYSWNKNEWTEEALEYFTHQYVGNTKYNAARADYCAFCDKEFVRIQTHVKGAAHKAQVIRTFRLVMSALTSEGFKKYNKEGVEGFVKKRRTRKRKEREGEQDASKAL